MALTEGVNAAWRLYRFALISGAGWLLDLTVLTLLVHMGVTTFAANMVSAALALTFVFVVAQRKTFTHSGSLIFGKFACYALFNAAAVFLASVLIDVLARWLLGPATALLAASQPWMSGFVSLRVVASLTAKIAVTPLTLYSNFLFMGWLLEGRASFR